MGGVCPCLAGVEKAAGGTNAKPATEKPAVKESQPLVQPAVEPTTLPPTKVDDAKKNEEQKVAVTMMPDDGSNVVLYPPGSVRPAEEQKVADVAADGALEPQSLGGCLEVWSNSYNAWCPGVIQACDSQQVLLAYQVPGEPVDANISTKTLPIESQEIRVPIDTGSWLTASVEVYSHSNKAWCLGKVTEIVQGVLSVVFFYPNEPPDAVPVMKQLALGDKDLRLRGIDAALAYPAGGLGHETLQVGSPVEVYSNSLGVWCLGEVLLLENGVANIAFYYPDMDKDKDEPAQKELPLGHQDLRLPGMVAGANYGPPVEEKDIAIGGKLEVFSQSRSVWLESEIKEISAEGMVTVQLRYPDMPPDSALFEKVLPIGHPDMRLPLNGSS